MTVRSFRWLPLVALTLTLAVGSTSFAGDKAARRAEKAGQANKMAKMLDQLDLTAAQKTQITPLLENSATQRKTLRADTTLTPEQKKEKMKEAQLEMREKLAAILTPEQKQKMKALRKAQKAEKDGAAKKAN